VLNGVDGRQGTPPSFPLLGWRLRWRGEGERAEKLPAGHSSSNCRPTSHTSSEERSPNRGPQVLIDLTSNSEDEKGKGKKPKSSNQMHKKQGKGKKQVLIILFQIHD